MTDLSAFQHPRFARMYERISAESERRGTAEHRDRALAGLSGRVVLMVPVAGWHSSHRLPRIHGATLAKPIGLEPLRAALAKILNPDAQAPAPAAAVPVEQIGANVLLVEDNPVNQHIATVMLRRLGCTVVVASDGASAVAPAGQDEKSAAKGASRNSSSASR